MSIVNERIGELMQQKEITYRKLSEMTGISTGAIHRYIHGATENIGINKLWSIAFALGTTPEYLTGDTDDPSPQRISKRKGQNEILQIYDKTLNRMKEEPAFKEFISTAIDLDTPKIKIINNMIKTFREP